MLGEAQHPNPEVGQIPLAEIFIRAKPHIPNMAKPQKRRRRNMGKYLRGIVDEDLSLGTLAAKTLVKTNFDNTGQEELFCSSVVASWAIQEFTSANNDGPIMVGLAHSDYTVAEIEEYIENAASWSVGDKIAQEQAKRLVRIVGILRGTDSATVGSRLNNGVPIKTKLNWQLITGQTLAIWAYNLGSSALATTDPQLFVEGHANLWQR